MRGGILGGALALPAVARIDWSARIRSLEAPDNAHQLVSHRSLLAGKNPILQPLQLERQVGASPRPKPSRGSNTPMHCERSSILPGPPGP